jgi:hypothetical protein
VFLLFFNTRFTRIDPKRYWRELTGTWFMTISYHIDSALNLVSVRANGTLTSEDLLASATQLGADPRLKPLMPSLIDLSEVSDLEITAAGIKTLLPVLRETARRRGAAKAAIVAGSTSNSFMARLFKALAEADGTTMQYQIFENLGDARLWLEAP